MNRFKVASQLSKGELIIYEIRTKNWLLHQDKKGFGPVRTVEMQCLRDKIKITVKSSKGVVLNQKLLKKIDLEQR